MKKTLYAIAVVLTVSVSSSCEKWLEATSSTTIPVYRLMETRGGFCDALSGIYILMGNEYQYGGNMSFNFMDKVAYPYAYSSSVNQKALQTHNYSNTYVKAQITETWRTNYNVVANINLVLQYLESNKDVLSSELEYKLFKGELLGLRAFTHFNLMRAFGLGDVRGENADKLTIPYVTLYDKEPVAQKTYSQTIELIRKDLDECLACLEETDPLAGKISNDDFDRMNQDSFWSNRKKHFNYFAALATRARLFQWMGDLANAAQTAQAVIDGSGELVEWVNPTSLIQEQMEKGNYSFSTEHIFSLEISEMLGKVSEMMIMTTGNDEYCIPEDFVDDILYPRIDPQTGSFAGAEDVRGPLVHLQYDRHNYKCYKLMPAIMSSWSDSGVFPMIRISEMYYMVAENLIAEGKGEDALRILDEVRRHRGISDDYNPALVNADEELMKEYYREFIAEGQIIYWLKHKGVSSSLSPSFTLSHQDLVIPYPQEEIDYGRVQEL